MKHRITSILALILALALLAGCGAPPAKDGTAANEPAAGENAGGEDASAAPYKIAVATNQSGLTWEIMRTYLDSEVAPALNMEFMYSETLTDANGLIDFMEKAYAAGCVGVINYVTANDAVSLGANRAEEWGIWFITENSALTEAVAGLPHNLGHCGAFAPAIAESYKQGFEALLSDGEKHGVFIFTGAAVGGKIGQGAASHAYAAQGMLETIRDAYGLEYEAEIDDIINRQEPGEVATSDPDVKIYLYPGLDVNAATTAALPVLQSGDYDIFAAVFNFSAFTNAIDDVEKSLNKDIKIIGTVSIEQQTATGFETLDSTGDTILIAAVLNPLTVAVGVKCAILYNALNGHGEAMKDNGDALLFGVRSWFCKDADTAAAVTGISKKGRHRNESIYGRGFSP